MELVVQPSNLNLSFESGQNLLDVLKGHGVAISYSCMAGRCGVCRCKIVQGEVQHSGPETGRPQQHKAQTVLACQSVLTHSCTIEIPDMDEVVTHPAKIVKGTVVAIEVLTHDIRRLRIRAAKPMEFSPGQYASLQFTPDHIRPYSWAGLPQDEEMEFHIRQVPDGRVSDYVFNHLAVGDAVRISGPLGTAYLRRKHAGVMLCVGGGTGIAPIVSIVRGAIEAGMDNPIHLYFGVRSPEDLYDQAVLERLAAEHGHMHLHVVVATGTAKVGQRSGLVTDAIRADLPSLKDARGYFCGAPAMVEALNALALELGMSESHIHADAFYPTGI
jgi:ferredoxin-NAD(P)+ reductase (naphthalene dioxygenase ferredoxin-specific)